MSLYVNEMAKAGGRYLSGKARLRGGETLPGAFFTTKKNDMQQQNEQPNQWGRQPDDPNNQLKKLLERIIQLGEPGQSYRMTWLQKQYHLLPVFLLTLGLSTLVMWLMLPFVEPLNLDILNIYIYMAGSIFVMVVLFFPRVRLLINLDGFFIGSNPAHRPPISMMLWLLCMWAAFVLLPHGILHFVDKLGRIEKISELSAMEKPQEARYLMLPDTLFTRLLPSPVQSVNYMDRVGKTRYFEYYGVFVPPDSSRQYQWLPSLNLRLDTIPADNQAWVDTVMSIYAQTGVVHYFRRMGHSGEKNHYYSLSLNMPKQKPVFYEKIEGSPEAEIKLAQRQLALIILGSVLFFSLSIFIIPVNQLYAPLYLQAGIPWWNPLLDRRRLPFRKIR